MQAWTVLLRGRRSGRRRTCKHTGRARRMVRTCGMTRRPVEGLSTDPRYCRRDGTSAPALMGGRTITTPRLVRIGTRRQPSLSSLPLPVRGRESHDSGQTLAWCTAPGRSRCPQKKEQESALLVRAFNVITGTLNKLCTTCTPSRNATLESD